MHAQNALSLLLAAIFERELPRASRILSTLGREFCQLTAAVAQLGIELHRQVRCGFYPDYDDPDYDDPDYDDPDYDDVDYDRNERPNEGPE